MQREWMGIGQAFGIRPHLFEQETLSSYLHRVASLNHTSYEHILKETLKKSKTPNKNLYNEKINNSIDLNPNINFDIKTLTNFLSRSKSELIDKHTLFHIYEKFGKYEKYKYQLAKKLYNYKERYFCPICIRQNKGVYKLHWQVSGVEVCEKHNCKLTNQCLHCKNILKYNSSKQGIGFCSHCNNPLDGEVVAIQDYKQLVNSATSIDDFYFLMDPNKLFYPQVNDFNMHISTAIALLYTVQGANEDASDSEVIDVEKIRSIMGYNHFNTIIKAAAGIKDVTITLSLLVEYFKKTNTSWISFSNIKVSEAYIQSVMDYYESMNILDNTPPKPICTCQICKSYNSDSMMSSQNRERVSFNKRVFYSLNICTGCFMQYGYDRSKQRWENITGILASYMDICKLVNEEYPIKVIARRQSCSIYKIYYVIGYLLKKSLLSQKVAKKYKKKFTVKSAELKIIFEEINDINFPVNEIIKKYKIHPVNFYYYYFSIGVQKRIFINGKEYLKEETKIKVDKFIKDSMKSGEVITLSRFHTEYGINRRALKRIGLNEYLLKAKDVQKEQLKKIKDQCLFNKVDKFFENNKWRLVPQKDIYDYLGITYSGMRRHHPDIYLKIVNLSNASKIAYKRRKIENEKYKIKLIFEREWEASNRLPLIREILEEVWNYRNGHFYEEDREVHNYYRELRNEYLKKD